jgi:hypothetical protein
MCRVKHITPVLIQQATDRVEQQNASVYAVEPYFPDGALSFHIQLAGSPGGFNLNASTTIAAGSIGTPPEPNLVLVPKNMKTRVPAAAEETALIMAVTFNSDDSITYYVRLNNGTRVKLYGDKFVHDIDLIDPSAPASLSLLTSHSLSELKRDVSGAYNDALFSARAEPVTIAKRGLEGISSYTASASEEACQLIKCLNNGGQPSMFNEYLNACQCQTLIAPEISLTKKDSRRHELQDQRLSRREEDKRLMRSVFGLSKPSSETCRSLISCQGESESFFDETTSQCLCVVYRAGVKEPVIVSDTILPRAEAELTQDQMDTLANTEKAVSWKPESVVSIKATVVLYCHQKTQECAAHPWKYSCDKDRNMFKGQVNDECDKACVCSGENLDDCHNVRWCPRKGRRDVAGVDDVDLGISARATEETNSELMSEVENIRPNGGVGEILRDHPGNGSAADDW